MVDPTLEQIITGVMDKLLGACSPADKKKVMEAVMQILTKGTAPGKAIGFDKNETEMMYSTALSQYNAGKYKEAGESFNYLHFLEPKDPRYAFGYAASLHKQHKYDKAIRYYTATAFLDKENPYPWFHSSECHLQLQNYPGASAALTQAIALSEKNPEYEKVKEMSIGLRDFIRQNFYQEAQQSPK